MTGDCVLHCMSDGMLPPREAAVGADVNDELAVDRWERDLPDWELEQHFGEGALEEFDATGEDPDLDRDAAARRMVDYAVTARQLGAKLSEGTAQAAARARDRLQRRKQELAQRGRPPLVSPPPPAGQRVRRARTRAPRRTAACRRARVADAGDDGDGSGPWTGLVEQASVPNSQPGAGIIVWESAPASVEVDRA